MLGSNHTQIKVQDEDIGKYFPVAVDLVQQPFLEQPQFHSICLRRKSNAEREGCFNW